MDAEELIRQATDTVRSALEGAQRRAQEIVAQAESEAQRIRADAEAAAKRIRAEAEDAAGRIRGEAEGQAQRRLEEVRGALDELRGRLSDDRGAPAAPPPGAPRPRADSAPASRQEPAEGGAPSTDELLAVVKAESDSSGPGPSPAAPTPSPGGHGSGGETAARLVAMKLALDGTPRDEARAQLAAEYEIDDLDGLLDEVYARAATITPRRPAG